MNNCLTKEETSLFVSENKYLKIYCLDEILLDKNEILNSALKKK
jgi:hypothetical protein